MEANVTIGPSSEVNGHSGIYLSINVHHMLLNLPDGYGSEQSINFLNDCWKLSISESKSIIENVINLGLKL